MQPLVLAAVSIALTTAALTPAVASDRTDIVAVVQAFNDAGNKGDRSAYVSYCTDDAVVMDHEPPYLFQGPTACGDEWDAVVSWSTEHKISADQLSIRFSEPVFVDVVGDRAYAVFPTIGRFAMNGTKMSEPEYAAFIMRRQGRSWRIAAMSWSTLGWKPVVP